MFYDLISAFNFYYSLRKGTNLSKSELFSNTDHPHTPDVKLLYYCPSNKSPVRRFFSLCGHKWSGRPDDTFFFSLLHIYPLGSPNSKGATYDRKEAIRKTVKIPNISTISIRISDYSVPRSSFYVRWAV